MAPQGLVWLTSSSSIWTPQIQQRLQEYYTQTRINVHNGWQTDRQMERERETDRWRERETDRQMERETVGWK